MRNQGEDQAQDRRAGRTRQGRGRAINDSMADHDDDEQQLDDDDAEEVSPQVVKRPKKKKKKVKKGTGPKAVAVVPEPPS